MDEWSEGNAVYASKGGGVAASVGLSKWISAGSRNRSATRAGVGDEGERQRDELVVHPAPAEAVHTPTAVKSLNPMAILRSRG